MSMKLVKFLENQRWRLLSLGVVSFTVTSITHLRGFSSSRSEASWWAGNCLAFDSTADACFNGTEKAKVVSCVNGNNELDVDGNRSTLKFVAFINVPGMGAFLEECWDNVSGKTRVIKANRSIVSGSPTDSTILALFLFVRALSGVSVEIFHLQEYSSLSDRFLPFSNSAGKLGPAEELLGRS